LAWYLQKSYTSLIIAVCFTDICWELVWNLEQNHFAELDDAVLLPHFMHHNRNYNSASLRKLHE
jgi:hypothetical protein